LEERNRSAAFFVKDVVAYLDQLNSRRTQPLWYQEAVIYEVNVRAFFDSDRNGNGDFSGFIQRLSNGLLTKRNCWRPVEKSC